MDWSWITTTIVDYGYVAIFLLMVAESACIPIPSEVTMLFGGALANATFVASLSGSPEPLNVILVGVAGTLGNLVGSWIAWGVGYWGGRPMIERFGRYVLLRQHHLDKAEVWFDKHGEAAVFFGRLLPVIRTFISLPAGVTRMNFGRFSTYTFAGCIPWTFALAFAGYALGSQWESFENNLRPVSIVIGVIVAVVIGWWLLRQYRKRQAVPSEVE
jgi:membrane protein DedA with SNARE-associated domain